MATGNGACWLGWVPFKDRSAETKAAHERILAGMHPFKVYGAPAGDAPKKVVLTDAWKHPLTVKALGFAFPRIHQLTGSCVGAGGYNAEFTLTAVEVIRLRQPEAIKLSFWPYTYGKSRQRAGMRGRGEGSIGSAYAEAARLDGYLDASLPGLPQMRQADGLVLTEDVEYEWSDGAAIDRKWADAAKPHVVRSTAPCNSADDVRAAIQNYYPVTIAYDYYLNAARVQGVGDQAVLLESDWNYGGHQTSVQGWWDHPTQGELFLYQNNWPASSYPADPAGGAACSAWITRKRMDHICRTGEAYAFSQFDGFPAQQVDLNFSPF